MSSLTCQSRKGGVLLQVLACVAAMCAGVWLGAEYLDVKVNDLAYTALDEAELLQQVPEELRPHKPGCPTGDCPEQTAEEHAEVLRNELQRLRGEAVALRKAAAGNIQALETVLTSSALEHNKLRRDRTIAYWERLCEVAKSVTYLHDEVAVAPNSNTTGHVLDLRRRAYEYGERAITSISSDDVDEQAVESGQRLTLWYQNGQKLYQQASAVWEGRTVDNPAALNQSTLMKIQQQHQNEARLIQEKASRVSEVLSRRYVVELPELGV